MTEMLGSGVQRRLFFVLLALGVGALSFGMRRSSVNMDLELDNDQSEYVGLARDFSQTGTYRQTSSYRAYQNYVPIGFPTLISVVHFFTKQPFHHSGVIVSLAFGVLIPILVGLICYRITESAVISFFCAVCTAMNWPMVYFGSTAMTESTYMFLYLLIAWLSLEMFIGPSDRKFLLSCAGLGILFGLTFLVRTATIYLLVGLPILIAIAAFTFKIVRRPRTFVVGVAVFLLLGSGVVFWNSYRLSLWNGKFSVSPQLGGNLGVGELVSKGDLSILKLNKTGEKVNLHDDIADQGGAISKWAENPLSRAKTVVINLYVNSYYLFDGLSNYVNDFTVFVCALIFFLVVIPIAVRVMRYILQSFKNPSIGSAATDRAVRSLVILVGLSLMHLVAYSLFMPWRRYVEQLIPVVMIIFGVCVYMVWNPDIARVSVPVIPEMFRIRVEEIRIKHVIQLIKMYVVQAPREWRIAVAIFAALAFVSVSGFYASTCWAKISSKRMLDPGQEASYQVMMRQGEYMKARAAELGVEPRIVALSVNVAYYAQGYGYMIPYTEEDPVKLSTYLRHHQINFVSTNRAVAIAEGQNGVNGVPIYFLLYTLSDANPEKTKRVMPGPFFDLTKMGMPEIKPLELAILDQSGKRSYLVMRRVTSPQWEKLYYDSACRKSSKSIFCSTFFRLGNDNGKPVWIQYTMFKDVDFAVLRAWLDQVPYSKNNLQLVDQRVYGVDQQ